VNVADERSSRLSNHFEKCQRMFEIRRHHGFDFVDFEPSSIRKDTQTIDDFGAGSTERVLDRGDSWRRFIELQWPANGELLAASGDARDIPGAASNS
jgi:hypothetical protein